ncbi:DNA-processing protein DprA [Helicobacter sp. 11S03491-1]|uniref:DNA-processing protein DprA n=1 Tax=Helicobacter sp. 11S03491-1 TaxID=1476196 RepID=UPI000BA716DF|nr:DNA-processing protein DprA [Helicobacter sp. 11S03491-1]PAF43036.1 DNA protecting protein DprA [Helicobacter sp. 11S03491-1]
MQSNFNFFKLESIPKSFDILKNKPNQLYYTGDPTLLQSTHKIGIVGTRRPSPYTKNFVFSLARKISQNNGVVVSGGALGVDIIAQNAALPRTIMVSPASLDIIYPPANVSIITQIAQKALILSEYEKNYAPKNYSFIERNRLVIALSDWVIIPEADLQSGSMQSAKIAKEYHKPIFVLPQRIIESKGTNYLLQNSLAQAIYDIDAFIQAIFGKQTKPQDEFLKYCKDMPTFEEAYLRYGDKVLEYEIEGKIVRENGLLKVTL